LGILDGLNGSLHILRKSPCKSKERAGREREREKE
jgi:hypothetical protein